MVRVILVNLKIALGNQVLLCFRELYYRGWLPRNTKIVGYARSKLNITDIRNQVDGYVNISESLSANYHEFWSNHNFYINGPYNDEGFRKLNRRLDEIENLDYSNRLFYYGLPPFVYESTATLVKEHLSNVR